VWDRTLATSTLSLLLLGADQTSAHLCLRACCRFERSTTSRMTASARRTSPSTCLTSLAGRCVCACARAHQTAFTFFSPPGPLHIRPNHGGTTVHTARQAAVPSPFNITTLPVQQKIAVVLPAWCCLARVSLCSLALHFHDAGVTVKHLETRGQVLSAAPLQVDQLITIALGIVAYMPPHVVVRHMAHCTLRDDKLTLNSLTLHSTCAFIHSPAPPNCNPHRQPHTHFNPRSVTTQLH
jgi:hypothetical protein